METSDTQPILASVDFSPESKAALLFASSLSYKEGRPLVVLHVMHDDGQNGAVYGKRSADAALLPTQEIAEKAMIDFISSVRQEHAGLEALGSARTMVVDGLPATRIPEVARKINAGHIVVGAKERGRLSRMFNNSVSKALAKNSPVSVTVIHSPEVEPADIN
jgi:nucleotide-binding universal stress UspA family protein